MFTHITLNWSPGTLASLFTPAHRIAVQTRMKVTFMFSGIAINITSTSTFNYVADQLVHATEHELTEVYGEGWD